jgi:hypothetical protein
MAGARHRAFVVEASGVQQASYRAEAGLNGPGRRATPVGVTHSHAAFRVVTMGFWH